MKHRNDSNSLIDDELLSAGDCLGLTRARLAGVGLLVNGIPVSQSIQSHIVP